MAFCVRSVTSFGAPTKGKLPMFRENFTSNIEDECAKRETTFTDEFVSDLSVINEEYVKHIAEKNYSVIPTDFDKFLTLYNNVVEEETLTGNPNIAQLLTITKNGLKGAAELYALYKQNVNLQVINSVLDEKLAAALSDVNKKLLPKDMAHGTVELKKTFYLAPLFSYYIRAFGLPEFGVGFDPVKLDIIKEVLEANNISLYS